MATPTEKELHWFHKKSKTAQTQYLKKHPKSKYHNSVKASKKVVLDEKMNASYDASTKARKSADKARASGSEKDHKKAAAKHRTAELRANKAVRASVKGTLEHKFFENQAKHHSTESKHHRDVVAMLNNQ